VDGKTCEGNKAWEEGLKRLSEMKALAIPNRPFSGKPVKIIAGKIPPDGDYRQPLTESELNLLQQVVPGLSIRVVDSKPELSDPQLELFLREYYHMGDSRIRTLTWANIFDACKSYVQNQKKKISTQSNNNNSQKTTSKSLLSDRQLEVWDSLEGKCLSAKELSKAQDLSEENIRKHIQAIRKKRGQNAIENTRSRGYWRLDSPPPDIMNKS
jgi:DNA-binding CsgD family transcriptional regulator